MLLLLVVEYAAIAKAAVWVGAGEVDGAGLRRQGRCGAWRGHALFLPADVDAPGIFRDVAFGDESGVHVVVCFAAIVVGLRR